MELKTLWGKMQAGNKSAAAFSEFCFDSSERHGIALSRLASVMATVIARIKSCQPLKDIPKPEIYDVVIKEADSLEPRFKALDKGPNSSGGLPLFVVLPISSLVVRPLVLRMSRLPPMLCTPGSRRPRYRRSICRA